MGLANTEEEIAERASRFIKAELKRANVTYAELARRLWDASIQMTGVDPGLAPA